MSQPTSISFRELCAELANELQGYKAANPMHCRELLDRARAALAQPEVQVLAHEAAARNAVESCLAQREEVLAAFIAKHGFCPDEAIQIEQRREDGSTTWRIERRAALAQPEPQEPSDEDLCKTLHQAICDFPPTHPSARDFDAHQYEIALEIRKARAILARWGRPALEPVAEVATPGEDYHEDLGPVLWWRFPVDEPPWCGSPNDSDWPGYHTHFTQLPTVPTLPVPQQQEVE